MAQILDLELARFTEMYWQFRIEYDAAALDATEYWKTVARTGSREITAQQISSLIEIDSRSWSHPAAVMPQWARDVHDAGFRTALLSNMPATVRDYILDCKWLPEFNTRIFSCDVRRTKPAPEIYEHCLRELGVGASDVLFLDDREANVRAAEALGMGAVLFQDPARALAEISRRFSLPAPSPFPQ